MDYAYELQDEAYFLGSYAPMKIKHPPSHYLKKMYFDTVTYHLPAARLVVETVGAGHVLYGSDAPPLTSLKPRAIKLVEDLKPPSASARRCSGAMPRTCSSFRSRARRRPPDRARTRRSTCSARKSTTR